MPDSWETLYAFNPNNPADAGQDADGDGMTNLQEYGAGTHPRSAASNLRVSIAGPAPVTIQFSAVTDKTYTVDYRNALGPGGWLVYTNIPAGPQRTVTINVQPGTISRFYRVRTP
jgi:hypothetical protein